MPSNKLVSGALYWRGINTETFVIRGGETWRTQFSFWISVNLSDTFKTNMKKNKQLFYVTILRRERPANCFLSGVQQIQVDTDIVSQYCYKSNTKKDL